MLGPLLFLIYVNDIIDVIPANVSIRLYADDSVIFKEIVSHDDHEVLQRCLVAISEWCSNWGMQLNAEKTVLLRVTRKKSPSEFHYQLENRTVTEVEKYTYLGVTLTNKLTWTTHISDICSAALKKLWFVRSKLKQAPIRTKMLPFNAIVRSKLEYAAEIWDPHTKNDILKLERVQRKAVRFIYGKYARKDSPSLLMSQNGIQTLQTRRKINRLVLLHNTLAAKNNMVLPSSVCRPTTRRTRHSHEHLLAPIFARTNAHKYGFFPRTVCEWNSLPIHVFESNDFMAALTNHFSCEFQ